MQKRIFSLLLGAALLFGGCGGKFGEKHNATDKYESVATFTAHYDYGNHIEGETTLLLDDLLLFFNPADYGIDRIVAGEQVKVYYDGVLEWQDTYPAVVWSENLEIGDVEIVKAKLIEFEVMENPGGGYSLADKTDWVTRYEMKVPNQYIFDASGSYAPLDASDVGKTIYGTYQDMDNVQIYGLYDYNPYGDFTPSEHVCNLAIVGGYEATCQAKGLQVIGCTSCSYIQEQTVLDKVECELAENGKCKWCGQTLEDLLPWVRTLECEFISVTQIREYYGVAPGHFKEVTRSESQADMETMLAYLKNCSLVQITDETKTQISGGGGVTMEFETENGTHTLTRANGFFRIDGKYYESKTPIPELSDGEACHAFVTYTGRSELYINGAKMQIQNGLIDKIHFRLVEGVMVQPELIGGTYLLTFDYEGKIELYSAKYFVHNGNLYEVVGTADFSQIFEEYPRTEDGYKTLCENCRKTDEGSIYRQEYGANLCDGCYQEFEEVIMLPCCFCGSYVCNGCQG
ncbi:MAG: hypothetical protein E7364_06885 [Clostridiales bacterium]|nr:hypothetical protein [Clostridiales bacterium]